MSQTEMHTETLESESLEIDLFLEALYRKYGYDFRDYSRASIKRRILHRMRVDEFETISAMQHQALYDLHFFQKLLLDFSISVTEMFRDPHFFLKLRTQILPQLKEAPLIRIWIAGCASGEEVYSFAILLKEEGVYEQSRIYATDINEVVLKQAQKGIFPIKKMKDYTSNYQKAGGQESFSKYYTAHYDSALMDESLKKNVVFAAHNLSTDSVFNEMDLISCRNVLIYFNKGLQDRVYQLFRDSLSLGGVLCLGSKESLDFSKIKKDFKAIAKHEKIYQKHPGFSESSIK